MGINQGIKQLQQTLNPNIDQTPLLSRMISKPTIEISQSFFKAK